MAQLKDRISSPLEAGVSLLDAHHLPSHLHDALEYASKRLARKALHVTLVVVRREYQLPTVLSPCNSPSLSPPVSPGPPSASSTRFTFATSPVASFKKLVRTGTGSMLPAFPSPTASDGMQSGMSSPAFSASSMESSGPRLRWPRSPTVPLSPPPMTPSTVSSSVTDTSGPMTPNPFGIRLIHADLLTDRQEKTLRQTIERAERKFDIGTDWLSPAVDASACRLTASLVRRSIIQNEVLFSSEGLALVSLDRLYTFKSALSSYSRTGSPLRLEDAVDELRRLILASGGKKVSKSDLLRSYDWLGVTDAALAEVDRMYRRAYGGPDKIGAIDGVGAAAQVTAMVKELEEEVDGMIAVAMDSIKIGKPPSPKGPALTLQTNFDAGAQPSGSQDDSSDDDAEQLTARPSSNNRGGICLWSPVSIAELLHDERAPSRLGPMTPNGYDDISPITRGEWGFLMGPNSWQGGRTAAVETC